MFSKNAVLSMRDGRLCLLFRVGDMRKSQLAEAHIRLQMIKKLATREGELLPFHQFDMDVGYDNGLDRVLVMWPITICHVIDEDSPLYDVSKMELANARFEILAILEGVAESTGSTVQARTSYLPSEILWGHRYRRSRSISHEQFVAASKNSFRISATMASTVSTTACFTRPIKCRVPATRRRSSTRCTKWASMCTLRRSTSDCTARMATATPHASRSSPRTTRQAQRR